MDILRKEYCTRCGSALEAFRTRAKSRGRPVTSDGPPPRRCGQAAWAAAGRPIFDTGEVSTSLSLNILTAKNIISQNSTGELTVEGVGLNFDAYLDIKKIARAQVLTLDGGWHRIRSSGGGATNGVLIFEKLSPVDGTLLLTPLSILNNGDILIQQNLFVGSTNVITEINTKQNIIKDKI